MTDIRKQLSKHADALPGDVFKAVFLEWLKTSDGSLVALDKALAEQALQYGEFDENLNFVPLSEEQMAQRSQAAIRNFEKTGHSISHAAVGQWIESLRTDNPQSCPK